MLIACTTKGCLSTTEAKLDRETGEVICEDCGNPITGITPFMRKSLESIGQVVRSKSKQAFQVLCKQCNQNRSLYMKEEKVYCKHCNTQILVSAAFMVGLKEFLNNKRKE